jgi:glycolate oxidase
MVSPDFPVSEILTELAAVTPVTTDSDVLSSHRRDEADMCDAGAPLALVRPRSTAEVTAIVKIAAAHHVPVVPQGARTGLAGAANASDGAIIMSLTAMDKIIEIDRVNRIAVVQPGVVNATLARAVAEAGLSYPPDPGSWETSTIGGNVSTNAGGMCCVKYGVTSTYVQALEVVLADGEVLRSGRRTAKGVAGYDLVHLFTGAEGTLGIITEITVGLRPAAEPGLTLAAMFRTVAAAGAAVTSIVTAGATPSLLELIDHTHLAAIEAYRPMGLNTTANALLLAAVDTGSRAAGDIARLAALCEEAGAAEVFTASDADEAAALLGARRAAHPAMERLAQTMFPGSGGLIIDDVAVPVSRLAEMIEGVEKISAEAGVAVGMVGHAGDGNLHPIIVVDRDDPSSVDAGHQVFDAILSLGLALGGTVTGEHGVGLLKRDWLAAELGPVGLRVHRAIKHALDPANILNPGKVVDVHAAS